MTHYRFTQSVQIQKSIFGLGIHAVPEEIEAHPHFLKYAEAGWIHEVSPEELVPVKRTELRGSDLAEKLRAKNKPKVEPKKKSPEPVREPVQVGIVTGTTGVDTTETKTIEQVPEGVQGDDEEELGCDAQGEDLTPQQRAARTRKANAEKAKAEKEA